MRKKSIKESILSTTIASIAGGGLFGTSFYLKYKKDIERLNIQLTDMKSKTLKEKIQKEIDDKRKKLVKDVIKWSLAGVVIGSVGINVKNIYKIIKNKLQLRKFKEEFAKELDNEIQKILKDQRKETLKKEKAKEILSRNVKNELEKSIDAAVDVAQKEKRVAELKQAKEEAFKRLSRVETTFQKMEEQFKRLKK